MLNLGFGLLLREDMVMPIVVVKVGFDSKFNQNQGDALRQAFIRSEPEIVSEQPMILITGAWEVGFD